MYRAVFMTRMLALVGAISLLACSEAGQTEMARGNVLASRKKLDEAAEAYRAAAKAAPNRARPRELLGHVLYDQNKVAEAKAAYEDAIRVEPAQALEARIVLARIEAESGRLDPALEQLGAILEENPGNVYAHLSRANLAIRRGGPNDAALAVQDTAAAMNIDPKNASVLYTRGCAFIAAREYGKATEAFNLLTERHPASPLGFYGRARLAAAQQQRADVVVNLREAHTRAKSSPGGWVVEDVRGDPAFQFMKEDPEFLKVTGS